MSMWSGLSLGAGAAAVGGSLVSGMPASPIADAVPAGVLMGAGVALIGVGAALHIIE